MLVRVGIFHSSLLLAVVGDVRARSPLGARKSRDYNYARRPKPPGGSVSRRVSSHLPAVYVVCIINVPIYACVYTYVYG